MDHPPPAGRRLRRRARQGNGTEPPDDDTETLQLNLHASTPTADIDGVSEDQSEDAVNDYSLLGVLVSVADPHLFEICAVKSFRADAGVHKLKVRRARFGTPKRSFATGDRAWIIHREALASYAHDAFAAYVPAGSTALFCLQARTAASEADLSDPVQCREVAYSFHEPESPSADFRKLATSSYMAAEQFKKEQVAIHEPHPLTPPFSSSGGEGLRRTGEGEATRSSPFTIGPDKTLYAKSTKAGMTESWVAQEDYEYWPSGYPVPLKPRRD